MSGPAYIGGEFCSRDNEPFLRDIGDHERFFPAAIGTAARAYFETGSDALAAILKAAGSPARIRIPANFCMDSLERVRAKLGRPLAAAVYADLAELRATAEAGDAVLLLHRNGLNEADRDAAAPFAKARGCVLIEDYVQAPLDLAGFAAAYAFTSLRKFACLDVAVAYAREGALESAAGRSRYHSLKQEASAAKSACAGRADPVAEEGYLARYRAAESALGSDAAVRAADGDDLRILRRLDFGSMREARRRNHAHLALALSRMGVAPMEGDYAYCMARFRERDALRSFLFGKGIFPAIHWRDSGSAEASATLSFHIDQRYGPAEMERIADALERYRSTGSSSA